MIRINFAKKKAAKPAGPRIKLSLPKVELPGRSTMYLLAFIGALGLLFYTYMEDIADYIYGVPPPVALVPQPIQPKPQAPPDTEPAADTSVQAVEEETPVPAQPVEKPVIEPAAAKPRETTPASPAESRAVSRISVGGTGASINSQVSAYLALRNALPSEKKYSLLAVEGGSFTSEISASSQETVVRYNEGIRSQLPGSLPRVQPGLAFDDPAEKRTIVSGNYRTGAPEARENVQERSPDEIVRRMYSLAQRHGFKLIGKKTGAEFSDNGKTRTPLLLKFTGNEPQTPAFLAAFKRELLNVELQKITGVPRWDQGNSMIQLAISLVVVRNR